MSRMIIGVMGPGNNPKPEDIDIAFALGKLIANKQWILLTGGRSAGVMDAAAKGAKHEGGMTVGILPGDDRKEMSPYIDIPIVTGMGSARNNINVLSSHAIVACGTGAGTASEIMLAAKAGKKVIVLNQSEAALAFYKEIAPNDIISASSPAEAMDILDSVI